MANDSDLKVNVDLLVESESRLRKIKKEFKNLGNHSDDMREHWGSGDITGAMDEFVVRQQARYGQTIGVLGASDDKDTVTMTAGQMRAP